MISFISSLIKLSCKPAKQIKVSWVAIGKYERNEAAPSLETAKNIADVFEVSLPYLVGDVLKPSFDKRMMERLQDFEMLIEKNRLLALLDPFLRDAKIKKAYMLLEILGRI